MTAVKTSSRPTRAGNTERRNGILGGFSAYVLWGVFPLYFHRLKSIRPIEVAALRIVLTATVVWGWLFFKRDTAWFRPLLRDRKRMSLVASAGLLITANWLIYVWAIPNGHGVDAAIGYFINPLLTVAIGVVVLKEKLRPAHKIALTFGAASVCVLTIAYGNVPWVALSLALTFASYGYIKKKLGLAGLHSLAAETFTVIPLGVAICAVLSARRGGMDTFHVPTSTMLLAFCAGIFTAVPLNLFSAAATRIPLAMIGLLQYVNPVMQLLCAVLAFHEKVSRARWIGIGLVCIALVTLAVDLVKELRIS